MKSVHCIIFIFFGLTLYGQDLISVQWLNSEQLEKNQQFIGKDIYDNTYLLENNTLKKKNNTQTGNYTNLKLGKLYRVDITNPLQLLLFYSDFKTFILLDKELSEVKEINLETGFSTLDITYVGVIIKKRCWMFNSANNTIFQYNLSDSEITPIYIIKSDKVKYCYSTLNNFFWIDSENTIRGIDIYGKEVLTYNLDSDLDEIQIEGLKKIFYRYQQKIYYIDLLENKKYLIQIPEKTVEGFFYNTQKLSIFTNQKINNYLINIP
jgi:hypothetical protein